MIREADNLDFANWLQKTCFAEYEIGHGHYYDEFWSMPFRFQQGVYLAYLRSKGIEFEIQRSQVVAYEYTYAVIIFNKEDEIIAPVIQAPDYNTALTEAIQKGMELI